MPQLHAIVVGQGPQRLVFLHGLFGQGKNFGTVAKLLGEQATSMLFDLPNHGRSPWTEEFDYGLFADLVATDLVQLGAEAHPVTLVGHSMGGKVAMQLALTNPDLIARLVVLDMSPVARANAAEFQFYADTMASLDAAQLTSRGVADSVLRGSIRSESIRAFLLQNLRRGDDPGTMRWVLNLDLLRRSMLTMASWPDQGDLHWDGPVLWLGGANSNYITDADLPAMQALFPNVQRRTIADAGHWLHAEQPRAVAEAIAQFMDLNPG